MPPRTSGTNQGGEFDVCGPQNMRSHLCACQHARLIHVEHTCMHVRHAHACAIPASICSNEDVYDVTVKPLVHTLFSNGKASCFAYGQVRLRMCLSVNVQSKEGTGSWGRNLETSTPLKSPAWLQPHGPAWLSIPPTPRSACSQPLLSNGCIPAHCCRPAPARRTRCSRCRCALRPTS